jgi:hypothetical protein
MEPYKAYNHKHTPYTLSFQNVYLEGQMEPHNCCQDGQRHTHARARAHTHTHTHTHIHTHTHLPLERESERESERERERESHLGIGDGHSSRKSSGTTVETNEHTHIRWGERMRILTQKPRQLFSSVDRSRKLKIKNTGENGDLYTNMKNEHLCLCVHARA